MAELAEHCYPLLNLELLQFIYIASESHLKHQRENTCSLGLSYYLHLISFATY